MLSARPAILEEVSLFLPRAPMAATSPCRLSVWLVEDDRRYRSTMITALDGASQVECDRAFEDAEGLLDALEASASSPPSVLLLDIHLPGRSGVDVLPRVREKAPDTAVVMLTISEEERLIFEAFQSGATGYLLKSAPFPDILEAIRQAAAGGTLMPPGVAEHVLAHFRETPSETYDLTVRELEVLQLMATGRSQKQIAEQLHISPHTVNSHVQHLYAKLQVNSGIEAVAKAVREQLI